MFIAALHEGSKETRVAITPNMVKNYTKLGIDILCEQGAGQASGFSDEAYQKEGASLTSRKALLKQANILVSVNEPNPKDLAYLPENALVITQIDNDPNHLVIKKCLSHPLSLFSMNLIPRISRAQSMDSLSSQANLAGYRAVIEAVYHYHRAVPMMMTAAGMIHPAKVLVLGAGVAGLQAIATAKRLGAVVYAFDVRATAKEQVESLGAEFVEVANNADNETSGGYAREMTEDYKAQQAALLSEYTELVDIVISTALIPGKPAPVLITENMVLKMKKGAIIVDLATSRGGNCALSQPEKIITHEGVTIVGFNNMAGFVPATASELYSGNILHLIKMLVPNHALMINPEDEIIKQALLCHDGQYLPFQQNKED